MNRGCGTKGLTVFWVADKYRSELELSKGRHQGDHLKVRHTHKSFDKPGLDLDSE